MLAKKFPKILLKHPFHPFIGKGTSHIIIFDMFLEQLVLSTLLAIENHDLC